MTLEIADHAVNLESVVLVDQGPRRILEGALGHVERDIAPERAGALHRAQQYAGFCGGSRSQLDQLTGGGVANDLIRTLSQDPELSPRGVILGQLADLLEQLRAARVVEV